MKDTSAAPATPSVLPAAAPPARRYLLRYCLMAYNAAQRIPELVEYCRRCGIESVMIHTESHDLHLRHRTLPEAEAYAAMVIRCGEALRAAGIEFGLNIWQTLGHHDAAFSSVAEFRWQPMVGHDGAMSARSPCPLDTRWQEHMAQVLSIYARCQPDYILLDDDFRWHNHYPVAWGCYCPDHLELFGRKIGRTVSREELLRLVYAPADPAFLNAEPQSTQKPQSNKGGVECCPDLDCVRAKSPAGAPPKPGSAPSASSVSSMAEGSGDRAPPERVVWHELLRETFEAIATRFEQAIHATSPATTVGLMSSAPAVHSAEGRLWHPLLRKLAGAGRTPMSRPCLGCYREFSAGEAMEGLALALTTCALLPPETRIAPELESSPFTRFNKSAAHLRLQMALSYFCVSPELTLDLHSFSSPELEEEPANTALLQHARRYFDRLAEAGLAAGPLRGVNVPLVERVSDFSRSQGLSPEGCVVQRAWETCLPQLGIPIAHTTVRHGDGTVTRRENALPMAISGDLPLAVDEETLRQWLRGPLLLDATAAECFALRGLGRLVGVAVGQAAGRCAVGAEEILDPAFGGQCGVRMPLRHMGGNIHHLTVDPAACTISRLLWGDEIGQPAEFGPGIVLFENEWGGRVAVLPYDGQTETLRAVQFRNYHRQRQMHAILAWLAPAASFLGLVGAANLAPLWKQTEDAVLLGVANLSLDPMPLNILWRNLPCPRHAAMETYDPARGLLAEPAPFAWDGGHLRFARPAAAWSVSLLVIRMGGPSRVAQQSTDGPTRRSRNQIVEESPG